MKSLRYHPLVKFLALVLLVLSLEGTAFFLWESIVSLSDGYHVSLSVELFHFLFYFPVSLSYTVVLAVIDVILLCYLCSVAGRSGKEGALRLNFFYRIPLDLWLCFAFFAYNALFVFTFEVFNYEVSSIFHAVAYYAIFLIPACTVLFAATLMNITVRFRAGTWWRNNAVTYAVCLLWRVLRWCLKLAMRVCRALGRILRKIWGFISAIPSVPLAVLFIASIFLMVLFSIWAGSAFCLVVTCLYAVFGILLGAIFSRRLEKGAERLAEGDLESHVDTSNLFGAYRKHAEHLNHIRKGMSNAVEAQMRSERMKTELITNVSHDIKTPLTSIINYVDLMKKEPIESETLKGYLEVMDRQSTRLKKLIEDLIEVSKASTGNIAVEAVPTDVSVLLEQATGEYRERLTAAELTFCVKNGAQGKQIMADGKLLWRIFDNLLGNICKYSQPGTRVYLNVDTQGEELVISFRNISRYSLNITSEELMERFVRGDSSRHTDGSGLGLSITKNLVELQKGKMEIVIDGDLFKSIVTFPLC